MAALVVDTHAALWYLANSAQLSARAVVVLDEAAQTGQPVYLPAISLVEIIYLVEKGILPQVALDRLQGVLADPSAGFVLAALDAKVAQAVQRVPRDVVPDMPDRIIAATAISLGLPLVTRDRKIRSAGLETIWWSELPGGCCESANRRISRSVRLIAEKH